MVLSTEGKVLPSGSLVGTEGRPSQLLGLKYFVTILYNVERKEFVSTEFTLPFTEFCKGSVIDVNTCHLLS